MPAQPRTSEQDPADSSAAPSASTLRARTLRWLAQREHSTAELRTKLRRLGGEPAAVDALLTQLQADGHLSEARFVASRIRLRSARYGTRRIEAELRQYGSSASCDELATLRSSELQRAAALWQRRFGTPAVTPQDRARQARFLQQRGFSGDVVRKVVGGLGGEPAGP